MAVGMGTMIPVLHPKFSTRMRVPLGGSANAPASDGTPSRVLLSCSPSGPALPATQSRQARVRRRGGPPHRPANLTEAPASRGVRQSFLPWQINEQQNRADEREREDAAPRAVVLSASDERSPCVGWRSMIDVARRRPRAPTRRVNTTTLGSTYGTKRHSLRRLATLTQKKAATPKRSRKRPSTATQ